VKITFDDGSWFNMDAGGFELAYYLECYHSGTRTLSGALVVRIEPLVSS
jgi:hypothetical protein